MPDKLITIANYLEPIEAEMLRNRLEEQGIRASLADVGVVSMAWYLSLAVGGIKLLVFEEDAEQAREIIGDMQEELAEARQLTIAAAEEQEAQLEEASAQAAEAEKDANVDQWWYVESVEETPLPADASPWTPPRAVDPPDEEAASLTREAADKDPQPSDVEDEDSEELPILNGREQLAWKAFRTTILGFYSPPLHLYASYLILKVLIDERPLEAKLKRKFRWAVLLNGAFWLACCLIIFLVNLPHSDGILEYRGIRTKI